MTAALASELANTRYASLVTVLADLPTPTTGTTITVHIAVMAGTCSVNIGATLVRVPVGGFMADACIVIEEWLATRSATLVGGRRPWKGGGMLAPTTATVA